MMFAGAKHSLSLGRCCDVRLHEPGNRLVDRHNHGIAELLVGRGVGNYDLVEFARSVEPHQPCALPRCQAARVAFRTLRHENFRPVLVVAGGESSCGVLACHLAEPESIPPGAMLLGVALKVVPEMVGKCILGRNRGLRSAGVGRLFRFGPVFGMENALELRPCRFGGEFEIGEVKCGVISEADKEDAFPMLWHEWLGIYHAVLDLISEFPCQRIADNSKSVAFVMADKVLDIFEQECLGSMMSNNPRHIEE